MINITGSLQEVFDKVVNHLLDQGRPAVDVDGSCEYRTKQQGKVLKCAFGIFIPDEEYNPKMEKKTASSLAMEDYVTFPSDKHRLLVQFLQDAHDDNVYVKLNGPNTFVLYHLSAQLYEIAAEFHLVFDQQKFLDTMQAKHPDLYPL